jgi:hypothetical protein
MATFEVPDGPTTIDLQRSGDAAGQAKQANDRPVRDHRR